MSESRQDLRTYIRDLEEAGELLRIKKELDPRSNLGGLAYQGENKLHKATLFENLKGYPGWRVVSYMCGSRRRLAVALGTTPKDFIRTMSEALERGLIPCKMVADGPVREVIWRGEDADLNRLPLHQHADADAGPYIGGGMGIVKDPETGIRNVSLCRHQLQDRYQLGISVGIMKHTYKIYQKYERMGKPMPIAVVNGHHGIHYLAATWTTAFGIDELEVAGSLMGKPVELVKCETIDLEVPADAEVVIEGEIAPNERALEGPFTEHTGYAKIGGGYNPFIKVKAITKRKDAIYYALQGGRPIAESQLLDGVGREVSLFSRLKDVSGYVDLKDVVFPTYCGGGHVVIVQLAPHVEGIVTDVLMAALSGQYNSPKIAIAVDEDVDPHDPTEVFWSMSTRTNPARDVFVIPNTTAVGLDPSMPLITPKDVFPGVRQGSRMGINATKPSSRIPKEREDLRRSIP
ncbi:MAG: UbiD family decarboxylase, partial [Dehalococcoidia bacterium]|nr:UbiD family decarboxylase [Dehalococcoidia bacterium]